MPKKILIISNTAWYIYNFRISLMRSLRDRGHAIIAVAPVDEYVARIQGEGFGFIPVAINRKGTNPFEDLLLAYRFYQMFKQEKPDVILTYTPKPNIYASLAARFLKIRLINNVEGLGYVFINPGFLTSIVQQLYKIAFKRSYRVFFLNDDDRKLFLEKRLTRKSTAEKIPGCGIDTRRFIPQSRDAERKEFVFYLVARLLWDKGVGEYVEAARLLKSKYPHAECRLVGFVDPENPQGISRQQIKSWVDEKIISYDGASDDIINVMKKADCIVLPSYREGLSKVLLEAASMAIPIIATDVTGCKEVIQDGITGYLCKLKNIDDLVKKMEQMLLLPEDERALMGKRGREKMICEFDERFVIQRYIDAIDSL